MAMRDDARFQPVQIGQLEGFRSLGDESRPRFLSLSHRAAFFGRFDLVVAERGCQ
jgi:hypothetical protein